MIRRTRSEPGLDVLRGVLVIAMFAVHTRRLQPGGTRLETVGDRLLDGLMWAEPFIAAGFLLVVGTSLALSHQSCADASSWRSRMLKRALWLYGLSALLFLPQYGLELPDLLVSSGILSVIAIAIVLVALALASARPVSALIAIAALGVLVTLLLDLWRVPVPGINAGPGGALPLVSFSALGALAELARQRRGRRALAPLVVGSSPVLALVLASDARWITERSSLYAEHSGLLALPSLLAEPATRVPIVFWNHSALGALALMAPLALALFVFLAPPARMLGARALGPLGLLGRHALAAYVLHLGVLGVLALAGLEPESALATWALIGGLVVLSLVAAIVLERRPQSPASTGAAAAQTRTL